ncbi:hypothetical protein [Alteribacillus sp. HJP-4]|uniref:hypothetical protein n=1 Tax=Alteribacillus sp. HJP-4 TaxID=2775394 RepID=UPI0035CCF93E
MKWYEILAAFFLPGFFCFCAMIVTICMQWMLEKDASAIQPRLVFHGVNIMFSLMIYGTASIVFHGMALNAIQEYGWVQFSLIAYVYPLPVIITVYILLSPLFRAFLKPYITNKNSNVIYLKKRNYKK